MESAARKQVQVCVLVVYRSNGAGDHLEILVEKSIVGFGSDLLDGLGPNPASKLAILMKYFEPFSICSQTG